MLKQWEALPSKDAYALFKTLSEKSPRFLDFIFSEKHQPSLQSVAHMIWDEAIDQNHTEFINQLLTRDTFVIALQEQSGKKEEFIKLLHDHVITEKEAKEKEKKEDKFISFLFKENKEAREAKKLCQHVVFGEYKEAKAMLDQNPRLVLHKARVQDYSFGQTGDKRREIEGTAYQMALGAGDVNRVILGGDDKPVLDVKGNIRVFHKDEGMAEMIQSYFIKALNNDEVESNAAIQKQQEQQFPGGYDAYQKSKEVQTKKANDSKALRKVIAAIKDANVSFTHREYNASKGEVVVDVKCEKALNEFRDYLRPKGTIRLGDHFNVELLIEAFKLYDDQKRFRDFGDDNESPKNVLMWRQVIGYIQRYLPACYAQAFCHSLYDVHRGEKLIRNTKFRFENVFYFPLDLSPVSRLGYQYAGNRIGGSEDYGRPRGRGLLEDVFRAKTTAYRVFMLQHPDNPSTEHTCHIM